MMSTSLIRAMSDHAAYRAAQDDLRPLVVEQDEDVRGIPSLGDYVPAGWRRAIWADLWATPRIYDSRKEDAEAYFMVDATGWGSPGEPALTQDEFIAYVAEAGQFRDDLGWAVREEGQFQVVVQVYIADPDAPGISAPEIEPCEYCDAIHGPLEECEEG